MDDDLSDPTFNVGTVWVLGCSPVNQADEMTESFKSIGTDPKNLCRNSFT